MQGPFEAWHPPPPALIHLCQRDVGGFNIYS